MNICLVEIGTRLPKYTPAYIEPGERTGRFDPRLAPKGFLLTYAPEWIEAVLRRKK